MEKIRRMCVTSAYSIHLLRNRTAENSKIEDEIENGIGARSALSERLSTR